MTTNLAGRLSLLSIVLIFPNIATAATFDSGYTAWMLTATVLVLFMTIPGLSLFYAGMVRSKNVLSVLMQCFAITCMASIIWIAVGYSLALNGDHSLWGSLDKAFLDGVTRDSIFLDKIPENVWVMFQMTFAIITPALIVGGFAERMKFSAMMLFSAFWLLLVYVPVCYWVWSDNGWLLQKGMIDFAGGTVVHINAGVAALVTAVYLGRRKGFPDTAMPPHNLTMTVAGAGMLWVGWFGFNAGSAIVMGDDLFRDAGSAMLVTHISAAMGALAWMTMEWMKYRKPSVLGIVTGMVAGLGTITPASGHVGPMGAMIIGLSAGVVCYFATHYIKRKLKIDDSLDVFPVHGVGGILGTMAVGVFAFTAGGINEPKDSEASVASAIIDQLGVQATGVVATIIWCGVLSWLILKVVDMMVGVRVSSEEELEGLDITMHEETGYNL